MPHVTANGAEPAPQDTLVLLDRVLHDLGTAPDFEWAEYGFALDSAADCAVHGHIEVKSSHAPQ